MADTLALWSPTTNAALPSLALGTVAPGSSGDVTFRVKNTSATYKAVGVVVSLTGAQATDCYLSADGVTFAASISLGTLPASATTTVLTLRRITPAAQATGAKTATVHLSATSWAA